MASQGTPTGRILLGLLCVACGVPAVLAAFDVGPLRRADINGPPWLGLLASGVFIAGGVALMLGKRWRDTPLAAGLVALIVGSFAAIGNWVAFGPGPRDCAIAVAGMWFAAGGWANEIACRAAFGIGAVLLDGFVLWMVAASVRGMVGPGRFPDLIERLAVAVLLLALAPLLLPLLLFPVGRILRESFATWRATGRWPRNEALIARMKAKRAQKP